MPAAGVMVEGKVRVDVGLVTPKERVEEGVGLAKDTGDEVNDDVAGAAVEVPNKAGAAKEVVVPVEVKKEGVVVGVAVDDVVLGADVTDDAAGVGVP